MRHRLFLLDESIGGAEPRGGWDELQRMEEAVQELPASAVRLRAELEYRAVEQSVEAVLRPLLLALATLAAAARERLIDGSG